MSLTNPTLSNIEANSNISLPLNQCDKINQILQPLEPVFCKEGQVIFSERQTTRGIYFVKSGKVKEYKHGSDGKEQILRITNPGSFIGYKGLLTNARYSVSASVMEHAILMFIPCNKFLYWFENDKTVAAYFSQLLSNALVETEKKLVSLAYKPVRGRLAEVLLSLEEVFADDHLAECQKIKISREDLASLVGTAKETVIRLLSELKSERLIRINGKQIDLLDRAGLEKIDKLYQ